MKKKIQHNKTKTKTKSKGKTRTVSGPSLWISITAVDNLVSHTKLYKVNGTTLDFSTAVLYYEGSTMTPLSDTDGQHTVLGYGAVQSFIPYRGAATLLLMNDGVINSESTYQDVRLLHDKTVLRRIFQDSTGVSGTWPAPDSVIPPGEVRIAATGYDYAILSIPNSLQSARLDLPFGQTSLVKPWVNGQDQFRPILSNTPSPAYKGVTYLPNGMYLVDDMSTYHVWKKQIVNNVGAILGERDLRTLPHVMDSLDFSYRLNLAYPGDTAVVTRSPFQKTFGFTYGASNEVNGSGSIDIRVQYDYANV